MGLKGSVGGSILGGSTGGFLGALGGGGSKPPNPQKTADAQAAANLAAITESARLNRYNIDSPYGSVFWDKSGSTDPSKWSQEITLSPEQQRLYDLSTALSGTRLEAGQDMLGKYRDLMTFLPSEGFDMSSAPGMSGYMTDRDYSADAKAVEDATFSRAMQLMNPQFEQRGRQLENRLATQGLPMGGEAYSGEMDRFDRSRNEAELAAAMEAVGAGRAEQSRRFGLDQAARQQTVSEMLTQRNQPYAELSAILGQMPQTPGGAQAPQAPQTAQYQAAAPDIAGLMQSNYQAQSAQDAAKKGGMTDMATSAAMVKAKAACIPDGQEIDVKGGTCRVENLEVGDMVIGFDGLPEQVLQKHEYLEDPTKPRFCVMTFDDETTLSVCDKHKIDGIPSEDYSAGESINGKEIASIEWVGGVKRSYDILTISGGYMMAGVPVNTMIVDLAIETARLAERV